MRFALISVLLLAGCADDPPVKKAEPPAPPITGRQAFQYMYGSSRIWATDSMPLTVRSLNPKEVKPEPGKAGAWEVIVVSEAQGRARTYTWSAVEAEGLHKGVFPGQQEAFHLAGSQPFSPALLKVDTDEALEAATKAAADYLKKPGDKPAVNFLLEYASATRFPNPVWKVLWGGSVSSADYTVTVDATTGKVVGKD